MSYKNTILLTIILMLLFSFVVYKKFTKKTEPVTGIPEIWSLNPETISRIDISLPKLKKGSAFLKVDQENWTMNDADQTQVDPRRWGGIVLLLSGPQAKRIISDRVEDFAQYGFSNPNIIVNLFVKEPEDTLKVLVGDKTPDEKSVYVMLSSYQTVYLLDRTWSDIIERLVLEPPGQIVRSIRSSKQRKQ